MRKLVTSRYTCDGAAAAPARDAARRARGNAQCRNTMERRKCNARRLYRHSPSAPSANTKMRVPGMNACAGSISTRPIIAPR